MELSTINGLWKCNKCGACTAVCPLYQHTVYEGMAARGKLALLEAVVEGKSIPPRALRAKLEDCLLCGACAANCPSLVPTTALFLEARAELARLDGIPLPLRLFLYALRTPRIMGAGMPALRMLQRTGLPQLLEERGERLCPNRSGRPCDGHRPFPLVPIGFVRCPSSLIGWSRSGPLPTSLAAS